MFTNRFTHRGQAPSPRSNHVATLYDDKLLLVFGGTSKSRTLNDLYSLDFETVRMFGNCNFETCLEFIFPFYLRKCQKFIFFSRFWKISSYVIFFFQMIWSRIKIRGLHPSPRAGCCGVLCGSKWYIAGGGSRKKRTSEYADIIPFIILLNHGLESRNLF